MSRKPPAEPTPALGAALPLRRQILDQLHASSRIVAALRRELAESRRQNAGLVREQRELTETLARLSWINDTLSADKDGRERRSVNETSRARDDSVRSENEQLRRHCSELEQKLAEKAVEAREGWEAAACLQQMVAELKAIIELLGPSTGSVGGDRGET